MWDLHYWGMPMMWIFWILLIALVVWLVVRTAKPRGIGPSGETKESPLEVLKKR